MNELSKGSVNVISMTPSMIKAEEQGEFLRQVEEIIIPHLDGLIDRIADRVIEKLSKAKNEKDEEEALDSVNFINISDGVMSWDKKRYEEE